MTWPHKSSRSTLVCHTSAMSVELITNTIQSWQGICYSIAQSVVGVALSVTRNLSTREAALVICGMHTNSH